MRTAGCNAARARRPCTNLVHFRVCLTGQSQPQMVARALDHASRMSSGLRIKMLEIGKGHFELSNSLE
jgi:hypothetical protein